MKQITIAAHKSGAGKTTITIGIMAALKKRGLTIAPFKIGPDYIDPKYHEAVCKNQSFNLDSWLLNKTYILEHFYNESEGKDISIIEGVMGLFDGYDGKTDSGSTAEVSKLIESPVILIVDAASTARSVAALLKGFEEFDKKLNLAGVIFNKVGSVRHFEIIKDAVKINCKAKILGYIPKDESLKMPSRHLGLTTDTKKILTPGFLNKLILTIEKHLNLDLLIKIASKDTKTFKSRKQTETIKTKFTLAVAKDRAFCFYYQDNFSILKNHGVKIKFFSPLKNRKLPKNIDGIYLGGGYPEIYAKELEKNEEMKKSIKDFAEKGGIIYAECGGLVYLTNSIKTIDNKTYKMAGVFPCKSKMLKKRAALGYVTVKIKQDCIIGKKGDVLKGHEYHYSEISKMPEKIHKNYSIEKNGKKSKDEGFSYRNVFASYVHLHFGMNPKIVERIINYEKTGNYSACTS